ncbi:MAG: hypothetical protein WAM14_17245 [Candidatus Nitrosopolaris sp.]
MNKLILNLASLLFCVGGEEALNCTKILLLIWFDLLTGDRVVVAGLFFAVLIYFASRGRNKRYHLKYTAGDTQTEYCYLFALLLVGC